MRRVLTFLDDLYKNNNCIKYTTITDLASELNLKRETLSKYIDILVDSKISVKKVIFEGNLI